MPAIQMSRDTDDSYTDALLNPEHQIEQVKSRGSAPPAPNCPYQRWFTDSTSRGKAGTMGYSCCQADGD